MARFQMREIRAPGWKFRLFVTVLLLGAAWAGATAYSAVQGPLEGQVAASQLTGTQSYVLAQFLARHDIPGMVWKAGVFLALLVWLHFGLCYYRYLSGSSAGDEAQAGSDQQ